METNDPTEWAFANTYLDNFTHWETLCESTWFKPYVARWRKELELKIRSENLARLMEVAKGKTRDSAAVSRFLLEKGWEPKEAPSKGRPSKALVKEQAFQIAQDRLRLNDDYQRISKIL